ncbi:hypothetical protein NDN08_002785 [Rhodosorus marinus]|uniref:Uncharacterized protein n=1 Tax=Rhodosorus marinus TaxID=101924 RepID=A0AAV8UZ00_9RHOD|nr:hypothetical protein NDN08_002785 [Rhodosorus marinus]
MNCVGFIFGGVGIEDWRKGGVLVCRRARPVRCVEDGSVGGLVGELERSLTSVRSELDKLEKAAGHLRKVERELMKAKNVLKGGDCESRSSSSSSSNEGEERRMRKEKKKLDKLARKEKLMELEQRREGRGLVEAEVCTGKPCMRNGALEVYSSLENMAQVNEGLSVQQCACLGKCKGTNPTVSINGSKLKESVSATKTRIRMELDEKVFQPEREKELPDVSRERPQIMLNGKDAPEFVVAQLMEGL